MLSNASSSSSAPSQADAIAQAVALLTSIGVNESSLCISSSSSSSSSRVHSIETAARTSLLPLCAYAYSPSSEEAGGSMITAVRGPMGHQFDTLEEEDMFIARNIAGALICIAFVALIAGLFMGLMTLNILDLQIMIHSSVRCCRLFLSFRCCCCREVL
jgi:hypothetical protein